MPALPEKLLTLSRVPMQMRENANNAQVINMPMSMARKPASLLGHCSDAPPHIVCVTLSFLKSNFHTQINAKPLLPAVCLCHKAPLI